MATAKHRAIDLLRRRTLLKRKHEEVGREIEAQLEMAAPDLEAAMDDDVGDDLLRLMFVTCHPVLSSEARVALTLRLLGGLTTEEIARAFLVPEPTVAQRIVRAKRTLAAARVPFEVPRGTELAARLLSVLEVLYLVFNEGYAATAGDDWMRPALCEEALAQLAPSPVVELNRAVALAMAFGPAAGAATTRHGRSSSARQRSRETHASASCSSSAPPRVRADRRRRGRGDESGASGALSLDSALFWLRGGDGVLLDEPVDRLLPELADRKVLKRLDGPLDDTVPTGRSPCATC